MQTDIWEKFNEKRQKTPVLFENNQEEKKNNGRIN